MNNIIVQKIDEDILLEDCDNSCASGETCVCKLLLGLDNAGQGMFVYGFDYCVLCMRFFFESKRYDQPPYKVVSDGYPVDWLVSNGTFIRFKPSDYCIDKEKTPRKIVQDCLNKKVVESTWISKLYETSVIRVSLSSTRWFIAVCETEGCKCPIHSYIDEHRAIGISNGYMDLETEQVCCALCNAPIRYINSDTDGLVRYKGIVYSRCRFCDTVVQYKPYNSIQVCTTCSQLKQKELLLKERVCMHCRNAISITKRGGFQKLQIQHKGNNKVSEKYLCRHHKLSNLDEATIYDYEYIVNLLT